MHPPEWQTSICQTGALRRGTLAQLVEQRTENPCVPGSIPGGTTLNPVNICFAGFFVFKGANKMRKL